MPAYLYATFDVTDSAAYERYRQQVPAVIAAHGGRFLVRGGATEVLEGEKRPEKQPMRQVILEFPDMAHLKAFYNAPDYGPLIALRQSATQNVQLLAIEGL